MLADAAAAGTQKAGIPFDRLEEPRRKEAAEALRFWHMLKQQQPKGSNNGSAIAAVLRYLGFDLKTGDAASVAIAHLAPTGCTPALSCLKARWPAPSRNSARRPEDVMRSSVSGSDPVQALLPHDFATCIWMPKRSSCFILGRSRHAKNAISFTASVATKNSPIAVLDETLLVFLAQERDVRLPAFLRCALPFSALSPYRPFQAGDIPAEIFFGREAFARKSNGKAGVVCCTAAANSASPPCYARLSVSLTTQNASNMPGW